MRSIAIPFVFLAACGGGGGDSQSGEPLQLEARLSSIQSTIFDRSCASFSACHDDSTPAGDLDLTAPLAYDQLVNEASTMSPSAMRVVPGEPDLSFLLRKLRGPLGEDEGVMMPFNNPPLDADEVDVIEEWVARGAAND
jgi:hypothetical protein